MKKSYYNITITTDDANQFIVYNSMHDSMIIADKELVSCLDTPQEIQKDAPDLYDSLIEQGFLVNAQLDEKQEYKVKLMNQRFNSDISEFMITTTYACNLDCPYCFEDKSAATHLKEPTLSHIMSFVKQETIKNESKELEIHLFGGEPLVHKKVSFGITDDLQQWCDERHIKLSVIIYTNGTLLDEEILSSLVKLRDNIRYVQVTIDGPKEIHDVRRPAKNKKGSYDRILEVLKIFGTHNIPTVLRVNIDKTNYNRVGELLDDLKKHGINFPIGYGFIREMTSACRNESTSTAILNPNQYLPQLWDLTLSKGFRVTVRPKTALNYCSAFKTSSYIIDMKGQVYKCAGLQGIDEHKIGEINSDGKIPVFGPRYYDFLSRDPLTMEPCKDCKNLPVCGGGCASYSFTQYGTYHQADCFNKSLFLTKQGIKLDMKYNDPERYAQLFHKQERNAL